MQCMSCDLCCKGRSRGVLTIKYSLTPLQIMLPPRQVHKQGVCCLQSTSNVYTVIVMPVEPLPWLISAQHAALGCSHDLLCIALLTWLTNHTPVGLHTPGVRDCYGRPQQLLRPGWLLCNNLHQTLHEQQTLVAVHAWLVQGELRSTCIS